MRGFLHDIVNGCDNNHRKYTKIDGSGSMIKCISCIYARQDKSASEGAWIAYECGNGKSEFYKCLLNVSVNGDKLKKISWSGCEYGVRRNELEYKGLSFTGASR